MFEAIVKSVFVILCAFLYLSALNSIREVYLLKASIRLRLHVRWCRIFNVPVLLLSQDLVNFLPSQCVCTCG